MRARRSLATLLATISLLAIPMLTTAQPEPDGTGPVAPLARQPDGHLPLEGTPWRLEGYRHRDRDAVPGPEVAAFLSFRTSSLEGSGGCSKVVGQYGTVGPALEIQLKRLPERNCSETLTIVQTAVDSGLKKAASYELEPGTTPAEDKLIIRSADGEELLRYGLDDLALLVGAEWRLVAYTVDGEAVAASDEPPAVVSFRPGDEAYYKRRQSGPLSGSTGCNGIVGRFFRQADVLSLSELERTDAPCTAALTVQEEAMTAVLDASAIRLELPYDRLVMTSEDSGERLEFTSQVRLEGATWQLRSGIDGLLNDARVTLRLVDGLASGEGPCGPYSASYVTDGVFITFRDARGARDQACAELKAEKALLDGLRAATTVARTPDRLQFKDARGATTLSLGQPFAP